MTPIRVGIVGAGGIVRDRHMPGLRAIDGVEVVAVCNQTKESGERFAREYGVANVYTDWRELVTSPDVDAVLIGAHPVTHCPVTVAALNAGKHVFCQARMAMNAREAKKMLDVARGNPTLVTMLCPAPTGIRGDWRIQELLSDGYIGTPYTIHVSALSNNWIDPNTPFHWRIDPKRSGVNTLNVGLYVEWVHRWFGPTRRISSQIKTVIPERRDPTSGEMRVVEYPDTVLIHGEMESGAVVSYEFSGVHHGAPESTITVYGSDGMLRYHVAGEVIVGARNGDTPRPIDVPDELVRHWQVEAEWIAAIRRENLDGIPFGRGNPTFEDGLRYMDVTEAVYHSAESGREVDLPLRDELRRNTPAIGRYGAC